jgi:hypothetical protein
MQICKFILTMLKSIEVFSVHSYKWQRIVPSAFRQFPNMFSYAQKRCARSDTTPLINACFLMSKYSSSVFAVNRSMLHMLHGVLSFFVSTLNLAVCCAKFD